MDQCNFVYHLVINLCCAQVPPTSVVTIVQFHVKVSVIMIILNELAPTYIVNEEEGCLLSLKKQITF